EEKLEIARRFLVPRQFAQAGLTAEQLSIPDESLKRVISRYTRGAGGRQLERANGRLTGKVGLRFAAGQTQAGTSGPEDVTEMLGPERFLSDAARKRLPAGVAAGLAWTEVGGEVLYVEASLLPDGRGLRLTGHLGEVMRESAQAAQSYIWAQARTLGIPRDL